MQKSQHTREYERLLDALRRAREDAGLTQLDAAERLGADAWSISKCEAGERRIDVVELAAFCRIYGVKLVDLLEEAGLA